MTIQLFVAPISIPSTRGLSPSMMMRIAFTLAALSLAVVPALAAERPTLRGDVVATGDILTVADLIEGMTGPEAERPLFRAPALGETGTIQAARIVDAVAGLGLPRVETAGRAQVSITRAARRVGVGEIEAAVKRGLEAQAGIDSRPLSILFDGTPALLVAPDVKTPLSVEDVVYDRRARRVSALVSIRPNPNERQASLRVTGSLVELMEVAVLNRSVNRGETVQASDITLEQRNRETLPQDIQGDASQLVGRIARRALGAGSTIRVGDLARPEIVTRGDVVTIVYEVPGLVLTLRGRASESGAQGDAIAVVNPQSKRTLQAQVVGPGKVSVSAPLPGPVASAASTQRQ
jgi:flagella basal body P-ring formation protein FlgA